MRHEVRLDTGSEQIEEAFVAQWFVEVGGQVTAGEPLVEVMTDKINMDVEAEVTGTVVELCVEEEGRVSPGDVLAVIEVPEA